MPRVERMPHGHESRPGDELVRLRRFFEVADEMLVALAANETVVDVNPTACRVLGASLGDLVGRNWFDTFVPEGEREQVRRIFHDALAGRAELPERYVNEIGSLDGTVRTIAWRNLLLPQAHEGGAVSYSSGTDITEKLAAERALRASERRYREIVQTTDEGVWIIDAEGETAFANERMASMLGVTVAEMAGRSLFDFMDDEGRAQAQRNLQRRREGIREQHPFVFRRPDGTPVHTWITTNPIYDDAGQVVGALGMVTDVTERVRAEEEREQLRVKMESLQRLDSLGVLAGGVAHDFNNLLVGILGNAELVRQLEGLPAFARERLDVLVEAAERAAGLTGQLLDYAGQGESRVEVVDLRAHVDAMVELAHASVPAQVRLEVEQEGRGPLWIATDPDRLLQLVANLTRNAAESYGSGPGVVVVRTGNGARPWPSDALVLVEPARGQGALGILEVQDRGCGMDAVTSGRMFEPFFSTKGVGRGLGMSTALGFVRSQGGGLSVRSAPGVGTCVRVELPLVEAPSAAADSGPVFAAESASTPARILVVDDEAMVRDLAATVLRTRSHRVDEASSGREAIDLAQAGTRHDLLVIDFSMPDLDGEATLGRLRELGFQAPALVCSGFLERDVLERFERLRPVAFLHKPYPPQRLLAAVAQLLAARGKRG